jgi:hypothetical protein
MIVIYFYGKTTSIYIIVNLWKKTERFWLAADGSIDELARLKAQKSNFHPLNIQNSDISYPSSRNI